MPANEKVMAANASSAVAGTRSAIMRVTGWPVRNEVPRSPVIAFRRNVRVLRRQRPVESEIRPQFRDLLR